MELSCQSWYRIQKICEYLPKIVVKKIDRIFANFPIIYFCFFHIFYDIALVCSLVIPKPIQIYSRMVLIVSFYHHIHIYYVYNVINYGKVNLTEKGKMKPYCIHTCSHWKYEYSCREIEVLFENKTGLTKIQWRPTNHEKRIDWKCRRY